MKEVSMVALRNPIYPQLFLHGLRTDDGKWSLPGGHAKYGETPDEAARREFFEETGMTLLDPVMVWKEFLPSHDDPDGVIVHLFTGRAEGEPTPVNDPDHEFVTYKWLDPAQHPNMAVEKDSNALIHWVYHNLGLDKNELEKGRMQRVARFNPAKDIPEEEHEKISQWQEYKPPELYDTDNPSEWSDPSEWRERIGPMHPAAKQRALHKLAGKTHVRVNPHTKEREFLLHRGMSPDEHMTSVSGGFANSHHRTSWTPNENIARSFTSPEQAKAMGASKERLGWDKGHLVSAWIPESKIHHMPFVYGSQQGIKPHNPNIMRDEMEVIVKPNHRSEVATPESVPQSSKFHQAITEREPGAISGQQFVNKVYKDAQLKAIANLPKDQQAAVKEKLGYNKSESLTKGLKGDWKKQGYYLRYHKPGTYAPGERYRQIHMVTAHDIAGKKVGQLAGEDTGDGNFQAIMVNVDPQHRRRGIGSSMYGLMERATKLKATPDLESQSAEAEKMWDQPNRPFGRKPNM